MCLILSFRLLINQVFNFVGIYYDQKLFSEPFSLFYKRFYGYWQKISRWGNYYLG